MLTVMAVSVVTVVMAVTVMSVTTMVVMMLMVAMMVTRDTSETTTCCGLWTPGVPSQLEVCPRGWKSHRYPICAVDLREQDPSDRAAIHYDLFLHRMRCGCCMHVCLVSNSCYLL